MITTDFFMYVSKTNVSNRADNQSKNYERGNKSDFEGILNSKKDTTNHQTYQSRKNSKVNTINNQRNKQYGMQSTDNTTKEQIKDNDSNRINQKKQFKNSKPNDVKDEEKANSILDETDEENKNASNYSYSASLALSMVDFDSKDLIELTDEVSESLLFEVASINHLAESNSDSGMDTETVQHDIVMTADLTETSNNILFELDDILKQQYETANNQETEIAQTNVDDNEESLFTLEPKESDKNILEATKHSSFFQKLNNDEKNQAMDKTADSQVKIDIIDKGISLKSLSEEKELVSNKEVQLTDDLDTQTIIKPREQNVFPQFNDNNLNFSERALADGLNSVVKQREVTLGKENIFEQIVEQVKIDMDSTDEIRVKLKPEFLGEISLKLSTEKGIITAKAYVENYNVKQLIESNLDNLKENMKELGLNFEALDVSIGKDSEFERNKEHTWKHTKRVKAKRPSIDKISGNLAYEEDIKQIAGGLYSAEGSIDFIV